MTRLIARTSRLKRTTRLRAWRVVTALSTLLILSACATKSVYVEEEEDPEPGMGPDVPVSSTNKGLSAEQPALPLFETDGAPLAVMLEACPDASGDDYVFKELPSGKLTFHQREGALFASPWVSYSGGCAEHTWSACITGKEGSSDLDVTLYHDAHGDSCEMQADSPGDGRARRNAGLWPGGVSAPSDGARS